MSPLIIGKDPLMFKVDKRKGKAPSPPCSHIDSGASTPTRGQTHQGTTKRAFKPSWDVFAIVPNSKIIGINVPMPHQFMPQADEVSMLMIL
jgi:hypothetical protein